MGHPNGRRRTRRSHPLTPFHTQMGVPHTDARSQHVALTEPGHRPGHSVAKEPEVPAEGTIIAGPPHRGNPPNSHPRAAPPGPCHAPPPDCPPRRRERRTGHGDELRAAVGGMPCHRGAVVPDRGVAHRLRVQDLRCRADRAGVISLFRNYVCGTHSFGSRLTALSVRTVPRSAATGIDPAGAEPAGPPRWTPRLSRPRP